jgi:hypothetical protein
MERDGRLVRDEGGGRVDEDRLVYKTRWKLEVLSITSSASDTILFP